MGESRRMSVPGGTQDGFERVWKKAQERLAAEKVKIPCRTTQHCANHGWCHRCDPEMAKLGNRVNHLLDENGLTYEQRASLYASIMREVHGQQQELRGEVDEARGRLARIGEMHTKNVVAGGMTDGTCGECGERDPCPTHVWATTVGRDPIMNTWDPADDEL